MAAVCQVTGAVPGFGHNISHSHRRTKRRFDPNVQKKTYYVPSLGRKITLNVSAKGIKVISNAGGLNPHGLARLVRAAKPGGHVAVRRTAAHCRRDGSQCDRR